MPKPKGISSLTLILLLALASIQAQDIKLSASVNRTSATDRDPLLFTVSIEGTTDFPEIPPPESPDFVVISGPSMSTSIQIINGQYSATKQITWQIAPTRTGRLTIPAIQVKYRGKVYSTEPIVVNITATSTPAKPQTSPPPTQPVPPTSAAAHNEVFLKAVPSKTSVYKGEELDITYELYYRNLRNIQLRKMPEVQGFWLEQFPENPNPVITNTVVNGVQYRKAVIKEIALFANSTGELTIDPLILDCEVVLQAQRRRSIFDEFFGDDFFNDPFFGGATVQKVSVPAEPIKIRVKPLPEAGKPANFTGAVGNFRLESSLDTSVVKQNQAITLRYIVRGSGNFNTLKLPEITFPANLEVFEPKIDKQVDKRTKPIQGSLTYEYVLIPRRPGAINLPALVFSYFDPGSESYRTLTSRAYTIRVEPSEDQVYRQGESWQKEAVTLLGQDIRYIMRPTSRLYPLGQSVFQTYWFYLLNGLTLLLLGAVVARNWFIKKARTDQTFLRRFSANTRAQQRFKMLEKSLANGADDQFYTQVYVLLTNFIADRINLPPAGIGVREIIQALEQKSVAPELISSIAQFLNRLDEIRFLPTAPDNTQPEPILNEARHLFNQLSKVI
jgi:hypothetical protein